MTGGWREPVLRMPLLREVQGEREALHGLALERLWPGLPRAPERGWRLPSNYPLKPETAASLLAEYEALDADALSQARNRAWKRENREERQNAAEFEALARFEKCGDAFEKGAERRQSRRAGSHVRGAESGEDHARKIWPQEGPDPPLADMVEAQKNLLWIWLAQGRALEIAALAAKFAQGAANFTRGYDGEGECLALDGLIGLSEDIWPSWRSVLYNAAPFLPQEATLLAEGCMRRDLLERLEFRPCGGDGILMARTDSAALLGIDWERMPRARRRKLLVLVGA